MKVYRQEDEHYPATYSFKSDTVGAEPAGWTTNNGTGCTTTVIAELDNHKNVLQLYDNNAATICQIYKSITQTADQIIEFYLTKDDVTVNNDNVDISLFEDATRIIYISQSKNDLSYYDGDWHSLKANCVVADTFLHIKIDLDDTANTFDVYIDGVLELEGGAYENNSTVAPNKIQFNTNAAQSDYKIYIDAIGFSTDTNYTPGNNLRDWDWTRLENVVEYPEITSTINQVGYGIIEVADFEGGLYSTWEPLDNIHVAITDGTGIYEDLFNENVIFRGYIVGKKFTHDAMFLEIKGLAEALNWHEFNNNYNLASGEISTGGVSPGGDTTRLTLDIGDVGETAFTWDNDMWIGDRNCGIMIVDTTGGLSSTVYDASAIATVGNHESTAGDETGTTSINDASLYEVICNQPDYFFHTTTATIDGANIATTNIIEKIVVNFKVGVKYYDTGGNLTKVVIQPQIMRDSVWINLCDEVQYSYNGPEQPDYIYVGSEEDEDGNLPDLITLFGDNTELAKYLTVDGGNYDELQGLRFIVANDFMRGYKFAIDYIGINIYYSTQTFSPIMKRITDNTATDIYCSAVNWSEEHVATDDTFYIGENTNKIIADISFKSGVDIFKIYDASTSTTILRPNEDVDCNWGSTEVNHYEGVDDAVEQPTAPTCGGDNTYAGDAHDGVDEVYGFETYNIGAGAVTQAVVWVYGSRDANCDNPEVAVKCGADWEDAQTISLTGAGAWYSKTFSDLSASQPWLDVLQVKLTSGNQPAEESVQICAVYVVITYYRNPFNKYMAASFRGNYCIEALQSVCDLEGCFWYEDYINNKISLVKLADVEDSGLIFTQADYEWDWLFDDQCNQYKAVEVIGDANNEIYQKIIDYDSTNTSQRVKQFIDEKIKTNGDAYEVATEQLEIYKVKRPSIRITVDGVQAAANPTETLNLTMVRPTVAAADYKIRKIIRSNRGTAGIKTTIYCGLGETEYIEKIGSNIKKALDLAHKALTNRQA